MSKLEVIGAVTVVGALLLPIIAGAISLAVLIALSCAEASVEITQNIISLLN